MARLDRFMPVKEIAPIGAVIGREFSYELVSAVAPLTATQLDEALSQLTDSGLAFSRGTPPEATYIFKHALVQDAAYDSLLKSKRQELHGKIAKALEERYPETIDTEPEVLAHHLSAAGATEKAVPLWQKAGELALERMALTEAISDLNKGLQLIETLPASADRDKSELALRIPLGTAWMALRGWPALEVWSSFHPALPLAKSLKRNDVLPPVLWGLFWNHLTRGRAAESLPWAEEMLEMAKTSGDSDLLVTGHATASGCCYFLGRLAESLKHRDKLLTHYEEDKHRHLADLLNHDPKTAVGVYATGVTWMLGYPDRAVQLFEETVARARRLGHPFDLGFALSQGSDVFDYRCEPEKARKYNEECDRLGRENSLPVLWALLAPVRYGLTLIRERNAAEGITQLKAGLSVWDAIGGKSDGPHFKSVLAEGIALTGKVDDALALINEQIAQVERPGWDERRHYAEILRLKGWMLTLKDDLKGAEKNYLASLDWAREQQAKSWELRTSTSLARLWKSQGKPKKARELLAPVYNWFTEGFDTKDLKEAKALLEELTA